jgi:hypothetical protein
VVRKVVLPYHPPEIGWFKDHANQPVPQANRLCRTAGAVWGWLKGGIALGSHCCHIHDERFVWPAAVASCVYYTQIWCKYKCPTACSRKCSRYPDTNPITSSNNSLLSTPLYPSHIHSIAHFCDLHTVNWLLHHSSELNCVYCGKVWRKVLLRTTKFTGATSPYLAANVLWPTSINI